MEDKSPEGMNDPKKQIPQVFEYDSNVKAERQSESARHCSGIVSMDEGTQIA
jgi:hypothetical protein